MTERRGKETAEKINLARIKKGQDHFEVVIHPDEAMAWKRNQETDVAPALVYPQIYSDAKKGELASEHKLEELFGTSNATEVAKQIIAKGEVQVTAEHRKQLHEQKKKRIIDLLHKQGVDPRTNTPHPIPRIESALEQSRAKIDEYKPAEQQVQPLLKALRPILPIKLVTKEIEVVIPAAHTGQAHHAVKSFGKILKEKWANDGSWHAKVEIPGGLETEFYDKLNSVTHGTVQATVTAVKGEEQ